MFKQIAICCILVSWSLTPTRAQAPVDRAWAMLQEGAAALKDDSRLHAMEALGLVSKSERARTLAESRLTDSESEVRAAAARALGQIGLKDAVPALKGTLSDQEAEVVFSATNALLRLGDPAAYAVYYAVLTGERKTGERLLESQLKLLKDPEALAKITLETGVGFIPFGGIGYKAVRGFTQDNVSPVRAAAAQHLADDPDPQSGRALMTAAGDDKWLVRAAAISAIAKRNDRSLLAAAASHMDDENETVRFEAAAAVAHLAGGR